MDNKNLEELIFQGYTTKEYDFLSGTITLRTLYNHEIQEIGRIVQGFDEKQIVYFYEILKRSIKFVNRITVPDIEIFLSSIDEPQFECLVRLYKDFFAWLSEDSQEIVVKAIRELVKGPYSRWIWKSVKVRNFEEWKDKWNYYRDEWVVRNLEEEETRQEDKLKGVVEVICSFIRPEAMQDAKVRSMFLKENDDAQNKSIEAEELMEKAVSGEVFPDEKDESIVEAIARHNKEQQEKEKVDEIEVFEVKNGRPTK